jgi:predicted nucleic-acid-binding protein
VISIDTNVVIRLIVRDDMTQFRKAQIFLDTNQVFVGFCVLMECEWVLRSQYQMQRLEVNAALGAFIRLGPVHVADREGLNWAIERHADGADFADMLHLLDAGSSEGFATFDGSLQKNAGTETPLQVILI